ncbi:MAG: serine hydrolase [Candidatus Pseudobacter hemicellulosilyticus]|uniref:Serine hydrolase n=1 Tax=Candidatus Pseudobacter hemicellulosilyticus TaxID=3121375 RepID=A0AAJ6BFJ1_9BACT|nr:MAG: serine hydrolase [Pseudobacter sp.]
MKRLFKFLLSTVFLVVLLFSAYALISGRTYLFKAVWYNFADIDDYKVFTNNTITTGAHQPWPVSGQYNKQPIPDSLKNKLEALKTVALLAIKNDSILAEQYWDGYTDSSWSGSFSMAKSITSLLIGAAIKDSLIRSVGQPVAEFLPEFAQDPYKAQVTIEQLLSMSSGSNWDESYSNPLSVTTELYYGSDAYAAATGVKIVKPSGTEFRYKSGDTQLLGLVLEKATGKSLSAYAAEKLWHPIGAEHPALWSTDHTGGHEKAYCCFNSNARDFARIGQLMLDSGRWKGQAIITPDYFARSIRPHGLTDEHGQKVDYYGYQWWIFPGKEQVFYARGILGQYIIVIPSRRVVLVRLGHQRSGQIINHAPAEVASLVNWGLQL